MQRNIERKLFEFITKILGGENGGVSITGKMVRDSKLTRGNVSVLIAEVEMYYAIEIPLDDTGLICLMSVKQFAEYIDARI